MKKINENIALSKSILNRLNISFDDEDYIKIRKMVGNSHNYVGILTKLRYIDNVLDFDELESIFNVLKNSKINVYDLNKLSYSEILDKFYNELNISNNNDIELIFKDDAYSYYRVYTYDGILKIGSPSWCLKTKSRWDEYQEKYSEQWVIIDNKYVNKLVTPNTNYLSKYHSNKGYVRFGISINSSGGFLGFNDNNHQIYYDYTNYTTFGILLTLRNIRSNIKKSHYDFIGGCEKIDDNKTIFEIKNINELKRIFQINESYIDNSKYLLCSSKYNFPYATVSITDYNICVDYLYDEIQDRLYDVFDNKNLTIYDKISKDVKNNIYYMPYLIKYGMKNIDDFRNHSLYEYEYDKWMLFKTDDHIIFVYKDFDTLKPLIRINGKLWETGNYQSVLYNINSDRLFIMIGDNIYDIDKNFDINISNYIRSIKKTNKKGIFKSIKKFLDNK